MDELNGASIFANRALIGALIHVLLFSLLFEFQVVFLTEADAADAGL